MITELGEKFTRIYLKYMPNAFVFAIILTLITALVTFFWLDVSPINIISGWYDGFFDLLAFGMQMVLILTTGFSIALSPLAKKVIDQLTKYIHKPKQVYFFVVLIGMLLSMVSWGWQVITCVLARELAIRVKGINYPFLIAIVYFSGGSWVTGLSSSIPLLLNTEKNFLIEGGVVSSIIPTSMTLGSTLNLIMIAVNLLVAPLIILLLAPKSSNKKQLSDLLESKSNDQELSVKQEADSFKLPFRALSDTFNNSSLLQMLIILMGLAYIAYHFTTKGFDLNLNIMIFIFLIVGMFLHKTPMRYVVSMKRSCSNISGIVFQYPFYAGIMGIMLYTGLGERLAGLLASVATIDSYPFYCYLTGGIINFAIPSAGGEFAVVGPSIISAIQELGAGLSQTEINAMISRASLAVAYGETLTNLLQPFFLLIVLPVMAAGVKLQARDIMGYLVLPFFIFFIIHSLLVVYVPI
ncbi:short-chain fatty acids transporter [Flavobacteriaceae bacterium MAR_2010_105]|nr:short-chain fatty acids transporter [Flavobacteriaceae bacterium MAR_2010_105]